MKIYRLLLFSAIALFCSHSTLQAQVIVLEKHALDKIKNGKAHIVVPSTTFARADEYLAVFMKYWNINNSVDFVAASSLDGNMIEGDAYFNIEEYTRTVNSATSIWLYLKLWTPTESAARKKKKWKSSNEIELAHVELSADKTTMLKGFMGEDDLAVTFDGDGHIYHWAPGYIKNYLIQLVAALQTGKTIDDPIKITNNEELKKLQNTALYFPSDDFNKISMFLKEKKIDVKDVFEDYKYQYEVIEEDRVNKMILEGKPFFYALFVRNNTGKFLGIINAQTGEVIYSRSVKGAFHMGPGNLNSGDIKDLYKAIKKS